MIDFSWLIDLIKGQYLTFGYLIVLVAVFLKHIVLVSLIWPGGTLLVLGVLFSLSGQLSFPLVVLFAWLGAVLGNMVNYELGRRGVLEILKASRFYPRLEPYLNLALRFIKKHGPFSIFLSQFIGHLRPVVCILAGGAKMPFRDFFLFQLPAALLWYIIFCGLAFLLALTLNVEAFLNNIGWGVVGLALIFGLIYNFFLKKKFQDFFEEEKK